MENENQNANASQGDGLAAAQALFANYKNDGNSNKKNNKLSGEQILAKYFTPRKEQEVFRILPPKAGKLHYEVAYFHVIQLNTPQGKRWKKVYCPQHNNAPEPKKDSNGNVVTDADGKPFLVPAPCPACDKKKALLATQDSSLKGIPKENYTPEQQKINDKNKEIFKDAIKYEAKKFYIYKGIDRGNTGDGVKFWRFKHNHKKQGILDKLIPVLSNFVDYYKVDFADPMKGTDITLNVVDNSLPNGNTFRDVSAIMTAPPTPLHNDSVIAEQWLKDETTWRDIFKPKKAPELDEYQFLERAIVGDDPYWDDSDPKKKKWVYPNPKDSDLQEKANTRGERSLGANTQQENITYASDVVGSSYNVNIQNVEKSDVGEFKDDAENIGAPQQSAPTQSATTQSAPPTEAPTSAPSTEQQQPPVTQQQDSGDGNYNSHDDLPF